MAVLVLIAVVVVLMHADRERVKSGLTVLPADYWAGVARRDAESGPVG